MVLVRLQRELEVLHPPSTQSARLNIIERLGDKETGTLVTGVYLITLKIGMKSDQRLGAKSARDKFGTFANHVGL